MSLVLAMCNTNRGIGVKGRLPWYLPKDLKHFSQVTSSVRNPQKRNAVIMGKLTWLSIPKKLRPLPKRLNVIISTSLSKETCDANEKANSDDYIICRSFHEAIQTILKNHSEEIETIYAIGGSQVFRESLTYPDGFLDRIYLTRVFDNVECDVFMEPANFLDSFAKLDQVEDAQNFNVEFNTVIKDETSNLEYCFEVYQKQKQ